MAQDGICRGFCEDQREEEAPLGSDFGVRRRWALCLGLKFEKLVTLDIMFYGASLRLEFVTLIVLRIRGAGIEEGVSGNRWFDRGDHFREFFRCCYGPGDGEKRERDDSGDQR